MPSRELNYTYCLAPMMDYTDRHFRYMLRLISPAVHLYTEMVTTGAIIHGDTDRFLRFHEAEHPVALQLGGSDPAELAECTKIATSYRYDEVNLNVGCPSDRVQSGRFGVCLMREPDRVADCVAAMQAVTDIPVTVKTRLGVDNDDSYEFLTTFIDKVSSVGCGTFIIHARKAWLNGLSPKENRDVPPLDYDRVYQLKKDYPHLNIILNGGVVSTQSIEDYLAHVDGVMIGREVVSNPWCFEIIQNNDTSIERRLSVIETYVKYAKEEVQRGVPLGTLGKPLLGMFSGLHRARVWRRHLSESMHKKEILPEFFLQTADRLYRND